VSKSINRKDRKGITQSSQRNKVQCFGLAYFAITWRSLRLKRSFPDYRRSENKGNSLETKQSIF